MSTPLLPTHFNARAQRSQATWLGLKQERSDSCNPWQAVCATGAGQARDTGRERTLAVVEHRIKVPAAHAPNNRHMLLATPSTFQVTSTKDNQISQGSTGERPRALDVAQAVAAQGQAVGAEAQAVVAHVEGALALERRVRVAVGLPGWGNMHTPCVRQHSRMTHGMTGAAGCIRMVEEEADVGSCRPNVKDHRMQETRQYRIVHAQPATNNYNAGLKRQEDVRHGTFCQPGRQATHHGHLDERGTVQDGAQAPLVLVAHIVQHEALAVVEARADVPALPLDQVALHLRRRQQRCGCQPLILE